jgi:hypothetical protein
MRLAPIGGRTRRLQRGLPAAGCIALAVLTGCAQVSREFEPPPVDPASPIAAYAERVSNEWFPVPNFQEVPPKPEDVPQPSGFKTAVVNQIQIRRALEAWRIKHPQMSFDTEAWAARQKGRIPASQTTPVDVAHDAESEAFARRLKEEAVKPQ